ncbi:MAG: phosphoenolpyruvate--protein phosphotransferase [Candidatus Cloacimonadales bacterium]|jgi:phosphotransferase system enzyme I (PtsI)|nr:phosphoenolpyruvate--protein phosphotransferase [Candidatus Cloacimonadales bacterium]
MEIIKGVEVSLGIGIGTAVLLEAQEHVFDMGLIDKSEIENEQNRYHQAVEIISKNIDNNLIAFDMSDEDKDIFEAHKLILTDPVIKDGVFLLISEKLYNLEFALHIYFEKTINYFKTLENEFYAERANDYKDIYERLINSLHNNNQLITDDLDDMSVVVMDDISPSLIGELAKKKVQALVLSKGNKTSHAIILARAANIPVVTGIAFVGKIANGDELIVDANKGEVFVNPDKQILQNYYDLKQKDKHDAESLKNIIGLPAETSDGKTIHLLANIGMPEEINAAMDVNADGVGLFRTEFLYMERDNLPTEEEQFEAYKLVAIKSKGKPVVIRTMDIGGDKMAKWYPHLNEKNPYLGCRGIRFSLKYPEIFKTQIRAIIRAAKYGNLLIMFPLISSIEEFRKAKDYVEECKKELKLAELIKIGTMIEIPSAALIADQLAKESDFFSIGTNDLLQYSVAVDRNNESIAEYYNPYNMAFLRLIKMTAEAANRHNIPIAVCGELAANESFVPLLIKLGVQELSVNVQSLLRIKRLIRKLNYQALTEYPQIIGDIADVAKIKENITLMNEKVFD